MWYCPATLSSNSYFSLSQGFWISWCIQYHKTLDRPVPRLIYFPNEFSAPFFLAAGRREARIWFTIEIGQCLYTLKRIVYIILIGSRCLKIFSSISYRVRRMNSINELSLLYNLAIEIEYPNFTILRDLDSTSFPQLPNPVHPIIAVDFTKNGHCPKGSVAVSINLNYIVGYPLNVSPNTQRIPFNTESLILDFCSSLDVQRSIMPFSNVASVNPKANPGATIPLHELVIISNVPSVNPCH